MPYAMSIERVAEFQIHKVFFYLSVKVVFLFVSQSGFCNDFFYVMTMAVTYPERPGW